MKVFIVIPTYNNANKIGGVISDLIDHNYRNIIVVDDGSRDATLSEIKKYPVIYLCHTINRGQGAALETGNEYARRQGADAVVHFDADGQMRAGDIEILLNPLKRENYQLVLGSRYLSSESNLPLIKRFIYLPIGRIVNFIFTGMWLTDAHCGLRALRSDALEKIQITQDRMAHATEILEKISTAKLKFKEVPVNIKYDHFGQGLGGINGAWQTVKDLVKARFLK